MANWKDIGVVPDSDEEDDFDLESQITRVEEDSHEAKTQSGIATTYSQHKKSENVPEAQNEQQSGKEDDSDVGSHEPRIQTGTTATSVQYEILSEVQTKIPEDRKKAELKAMGSSTVARNQLEASSETPSQPSSELSSLHEIARPRSRHDPPASPKIFKVPRLFFEDENPEDSTQNPFEKNTSQDEISRSYVQISSPKPSRLSSPDMEPSLPPNRPSCAQLGPRSSLNAEIKELLDDQLSGQAQLMSRRSTRERKLIQLNPYRIDVERYNRVLEARGVEAVERKTLLQYERHSRSRLSASPDYEPQQADSQDADFVADETQPMDLDSNPLPSSSPLTPNVRDKRLSQEQSEDDDGFEFPDIDKLFQKQTDAMLKAPRKRIKSYSTKLKKQPLSRIQTKSNDGLPRQPVGDIFDIPASPPATSSPFAADFRRARQPLSRLSSTSSMGPAPSLPLQSILDTHGSHSLPSPASAVKPRFAPLPELSSDSEVPVTQRDGPSTSSSSDESVMIRKISKKIRGVLPASHLRLDQQEGARPPSRNVRESLSLSPVKIGNRRGVAKPRIRGNSQSPPQATNSGLMFLSDESGSARRGTDSDGVNDYTMRRTTTAIGLDPARFGDAEEGDAIDAMLPAKKRSSFLPQQKPRKRRRLGSATSQNKQGRITEHLTKSLTSTHPRKNTKTKGASTGGYKNVSKRSLRSAPPRLSILDIVDTPNGLHNEIPNFIKVAARAARSRKGQGRQSPTSKFIRLSTREDTQDVQSVLEEWREGKLQARASTRIDYEKRAPFRVPLDKMSQKRQVGLSRRSLKSRSQAPSISAVPRRLQIAKGQQLSRSDFTSRVDTPAQEYSLNTLEQVSPLIRQERYRNGSDKQHLVRPGQLEMSDFQYSRQDPTAAFQTNKKALDDLFRAARKCPPNKTNLPLGRFLYDEDIVISSMEKPPVVEALELTLSSDVPRADPGRIRKLKQRVPRRVDTGATTYRQPSEPLILDCFPTRSQSAVDEGQKLKGLGKFGTRYPHHFGILPLNRGTFFHSHTMIGQGLLSQIVKDVSPTMVYHARHPTTFMVGERTFSWGIWNDQVASEMGVCFDWLAEQPFTYINVRATNSNMAPVSLIASVLEFVRHHLSFSGSLDLSHFLARMIEVLKEYSPHLRLCKDLPHQTDRGHRIDTLSICTLLVLQLLNMARTQTAQPSLAYSLEDLLKTYAGHSVDILLADGLDGIRKLYEDLQYLSLRDRGIGPDQHAVQGWVILIKALQAAKISRGAFWDVVNPRLVENLNGISDAPAMEKMWYSMYSLLPLCEFDYEGFVIPGLRQNATFDNWSVPQQLIRRVISFYTTNPKQSPGFNDYCRSLFARCHYLMTHWGWWNCAGIIGTLFDIFASQKLAHLRNEEVYDSPHFLKELDGIPSLDIEPGDRCFHVFLKIVALGMKHLDDDGNVKALKNLVSRLLPNHDRQYSQNRAIRQRDIAALRNHHDLLCTLYWAAPAAERLSVNLIEQLVVADQSHNEACLVNLRAYESLARFVIARCFDGSSYGPLKAWQTNFFSKLYVQYLGIESELRKQAEASRKNGGDASTESLISATIVKNMTSTSVTMCISMVTMRSAIQVARSGVMLREALNIEMLSMALNPAIHANQQISEGLLSECLHVLSDYMDQIQKLHPPSTMPIGHAIEDDSQDSLDAVDWEREDSIKQLRSKIVDSMGLLLRKYIETSSEKTRDLKVTPTFVECWARLVALVTDNEIMLEDESMKLISFLMHGKNAAFDSRHSFKVANENWPLFLAKLVQYGKTLDDFQLPDFNIASEWLLAILDPKTLALSAQSLSLQMREMRHYLAPDASYDTLSGLYMVRGAIRKMSNILMEKTSDSQISLTKRDAHRQFSEMLGEVMKSMQRTLETLIPGSDDHTSYVLFAQLIIEDIKSYASDFRPLLEFFVHPSKHYWPPEGDPDLYGAGIVSYCIRLDQQPEKTSWELFYFLHSGWKRSIVSGRMVSFAKCINQGMKRWDFYKFMLAEFVPPVLEAGFQAGGWVLASIFLPPLARRVAPLLENTDFKAQWVFEHIINLLKIIMNGTIGQSRRPGGIQKSHRGMLAVAYKFWFEIASPMRQFIERYPEHCDTLLEVVNPLSGFIYHAIRTFSSHEQEFWQASGKLDFQKSRYYDKFAEVLGRDVKEYWDFEDVVREKVVVRGRNREKSETQWFRFTLQQVLEGEVEIYQVMFPDEGMGVVARRNRFIDDVFF